MLCQDLEAFLLDSIEVLLPHRVEVETAFLDKFGQEGTQAVRRTQLIGYLPGIWSL